MQEATVLNMAKLWEYFNALGQLDTLSAFISRVDVGNNPDIIPCQPAVTGTSIKQNYVSGHYSETFVSLRRCEGQAQLTQPPKDN